MTTSDAAALRRELADRLAAEGLLRSPSWRAAVEAVPRELFLGQAVFRFETDETKPPWTPVRRSDADEPAWLAMAYADRTWVTQVEDVPADRAEGPLDGAPTSSSSLPGLVVGMLEDLDVHEGHSVLEIATGTGYSTALLCHRLGAEAVTSVEIDPRVAERARRALHAIGQHPRLVVGDGFGGADTGADYDRIIATCSWRYLPQPWLYQVDTGAKILLTLSGWMDANAQVMLEVDEAGTAQGRFLPGYRSFMMARSHQPPPHGPVFFPPGADEHPTDVGPELLDDWTGRFLAQLAAPAAQHIGNAAETLLWDVVTGSQARVRADAQGPRVAQHGPVRLWDAVEEAAAAWRSAGRPHISAFGMTATPSEQRVWLGSPEGPTWRLPV
ncbi:hypothetical protein FZ103_10420 [Streptomonospora sp. PA3]|uniref:ATP-grasp peptide maturase system methyltransferase n=1 Tax=Streptomonospora sp. PA3 TaxID=2607326 RepID=UPI0012DE4AAA|nr:ATP-grasp peptide maturase system methyltransferase [Streptomonospora sp. PA3]MUL41584.1 hypothetical protein [Streptomonospora sp. PA3]